MKMTLTLQLSHWAGAEDVPNRLFSRNTDMTLELPLDHEEFDRSFTDLAGDAIPRMAAQLYRKLDQDATRYIERERKQAGHQQQFPFMKDEALVKKV